MIGLSIGIQERNTGAKVLEKKLKMSEHGVLKSTWIKILKKSKSSTDEEI